MKAIIAHRYGSPDVLAFEERPKPVPADDEVLIKVHNASVNPVDRLFRGEPFVLRIMTGLRKPKEIRFGYDLAGVVEAIGAKITQFQPGDRVFGMAPGSCAELVCAPESALAHKPDNVTFEQAASVPVAGLTALQGLRDKGRIRAGQRVLINGASGGVGTFAVQIARSFGAEVTAVCSTSKVDRIHSIGAHRVIDYTREDFTRGPAPYDLIFDGISNHPLSALRRVLTPEGTCVIAGGRKIWSLPARALEGSLRTRFGSQTFVMYVARRRKDDLTALARLLASGEIVPVIDRRYPLHEAPDAMRYLEEGHAAGKIVIACDLAASSS